MDSVLLYALLLLLLLCQLGSSPETPVVSCSSIEASCWAREREEKRVDIKTKLRFVQFVRKKEKREKDDDDDYDGKCNSDRKGTSEERNAIYFPFPPFSLIFFSALGRNAWKPDHGKRKSVRDGLSSL